MTIEPQAEIQLQEEPVQMEVHYPAQEEVRWETSMPSCQFNPIVLITNWIICTREIGMSNLFPV